MRICWRLGPVDRHRVRQYSGEFDEKKISRFALSFFNSQTSRFSFSFLFFLARRNFLFYSLELCFFYHVSCQFNVELCFNLDFFLRFSQSQSRQEQSYKHDQLRAEMEVDYLLD